MKTTFQAGQNVRGIKVGRFQIVKTELSKATGTEIVTVKEIGPEGQLASRKMRFTADCLVAE